MVLENQVQLEHTRQKLDELRELYDRTKAESSSTDHVRELTLQSLKRRMNRLEEEMTRFTIENGNSATPSA